TSTEVATAQLTGEEGTAVTIRVLKQNGIEVELELVRRPFSVATTVRSGLSNTGHAGLILCTSFGDETPKHWTEVITKYEDAVNTWIIDLSGNPGGTSTSGSSAAGRFVGSRITFYLRDGEDYYRYGFTTDINPRITDHPAILLTTGSTASSAELFSAAIRDYGAGIAVGQRTFGKGIAQQAFDETAFPELFDGDALKMTTYRFFSPDGATNDGLGVLPTLMISYENIYPVALLLSAPSEGKEGDLLDLDIAGSSFCVDLELAASEPYRSAFTELLEALPPSAKLYYCKQGQDWQEPTPAQLAQQLGLTGYTPRTFSDAAHSPYLHSINTLAVYGLVGGYGDGTFRPDAPVTRAEFCAMLTNLFGLELPPVSRSAFSDVNTASWYAPAVHAMHDKGYLTGYEDGSFRPDAPITQEEALCILAKATTYLNMFAYNIQAQGAQDGALDAYGHYSDWARPSAWLLDEFEVSLSGVQPQETASRALAAELLCRILTKTGVLWD
ncbi:MAG: S-layer homology domain-containing protein, partial [Oscillospiraceae bacterium]|nr:S-layer homology domain-containing protein [Oscillospiraceae bacterium]